MSDLTNEELRTQADLLTQITASLQANNDLYNQIEEKLNTQTQIINDINTCLSKTLENSKDINKELEKTNKVLTDISEFKLDFVSSNVLNSLKTDIDKVSRSTETNTIKIGKLLDTSSGLSEKFASRQSKISQMAADILKQQKDNAAETAKSARAAAKSASDKVKNTNKFLDCLKGFGSGVLKFTKISLKLTAFLFKGLANVLSVMKNVLGSALSVLTNMLKAVVSLPFAIANLGAVVGNTLRTEFVEGLGQAFEDLKEKFDMSGYIGENIIAMKNMAEKSSLEFYKPNSELVKFFGYGTEGLKRYFTNYGEMVDQLGYFGEVFAGEISKGEKLNLFYTKIRSAAGYSAEDMKYLAMDAYSKVASLGDTMKNAYNASVKIADQFNIDRKRQSKNFMVLRKDVVQFGHISNIELNKTAAVMTRMGLEMKEAAAVFNKFSTFEDASNAAAILGQTFGMNLNAMDMIKAEKPEEIFMMFRNAMLDTGKTFDELSRYEKSIMVQQTGMSAESLKAMMNYSAAGLTFEESRKRMEEASPEKRQQKALENLQTSIKEIRKVMTSNSFFSAFTDGLMTRLSYHTETRDTVMALSKGYEGLYEYAANLDPDTITKLIRPIRYVIDTMRAIFESDAFKTGVKYLLEGFGNLLNTAFDLSPPEIVAESVRGRINKGIDITKIKIGDNLSEEVGQNLVKKIKALEEEAGLDNTNVLVSDQTKQSYKDYQAAAKSKGITLEQHLHSLLSALGKDSQEEMQKIQQELNEKDVKINDTTQQVKDAASKTIDLNADNVSVLSGLTGKIVKALIIGVMTGTTALLKTANSQLDKMNLPEGERPSLLGLLTGIKQEEANQLIDGLTTAISDTFSKAGKLGGIGMMITGQMMSLFKDVAFFFADIFAIALKGAMGYDMKVSDFRSYESAERFVSMQPNQKSDADLLKSFKKTGFVGEDIHAGTTKTGSDTIGFKKTGRSTLSLSKSSYDVNANQERTLVEALKVIGVNQNNSNLSPELLSQLKSIDVKAKGAALISALRETGDNELSIKEANELIRLAYNVLSEKTKTPAPEDTPPPAAAKDLLGIFELDNLFAKSEYKFIGRDGKEIDLNTKAGALGQGSGIVTSIMRDKEGMSEDLAEVSSLVKDIYHGNNFQGNNSRKLELKRKISELNKKISEAMKNVDKEDVLDITPVFSREDIINLQRELAKNNFIQVLSDPQYAQGGYYYDLEHAKNATGNQGTYSIAQTNK
jgi:negative regulator of replication initiation